ncbi:uncharacterized protein LOC111075385 isoform X2 [Drosophila obscura]|uniref:uncharacterized protein LOC111075385 isoform X2 n=1 Tax=Drosophila obscura TaxID=7282 RepID=UPI000BA01374|nr:uncharacterized protein LOC111075385 isoform X2 [Drosophila obscura]
MIPEHVPLASMANMPSVVQFGANKDFQTRTHQQELDKSFLGFQKRNWMHSNGKLDTAREREILKSLLATTIDTDHSGRSLDDLIPNGICYRDLATLTDEDLQLFGFTSALHRKEMLNTFAQMPNQDPSYDYLCNTELAKQYNSQILGKTTNHAMSLRASFAATNYKMQVMPVEDLVVGDKRYASRFALETLEQMSRDLKKIEKTVNELQKIDDNQAKGGSKKKLNFVTCAYYAAMALGLSCAWFWWWSKHSAPARLDRISVAT